MNIKHFARVMFPSIAKRYFDYIDYNEYLERKKTPPEEYSRLLMEEWTKRGGKEFDITKPTTYREKIQWSELYEPREIKAKLTDKVEVRSWVSEKVGEEYLIPIYGVYDDPQKINYDDLPDRFVIKMNHSSGMNIIVKDKKKCNFKKINKQLNEWMKIDYAFYRGFQPHYLGITPRIIIEKYTEDNCGELNDYKFLCFNGKVYFCWVDIGRFEDHRRNIYDLDWNLQPWTQKIPNYDGDVPKPKNFEEMCKIAHVLCQGFSHVRVDLYNVDGQIYFGEMTFSNGGGHDPIIPEEYDKIIGDLWHIE